jgi:hypothetical protein
MVHYAKVKRNGKCPKGYKRVRGRKVCVYVSKKR